MTIDTLPAVLICQTTRSHYANIIQCQRPAVLVQRSDQFFGSNILNNFENVPSMSSYSMLIIGLPLDSECVNSSIWLCDVKKIIF